MAWEKPGFAASGAVVDSGAQGFYGFGSRGLDGAGGLDGLDWRVLGGRKRGGTGMIQHEWGERCGNAS